jgi:hypothetical protein
MILFFNEVLNLLKRVSAEVFKLHNNVIRTTISTCNFISFSNEIIKMLKKIRRLLMIEAEFYNGIVRQ